MLLILQKLQKCLDQHLSEENSWTENIDMLALGCHIQKYEEMD
jgi:hypothetical protein